MIKKLAFMMVVLTIVMPAFALKKDPEYLKARRNGGDTRIVLSIIGDDGQPVSHAMVRVLMGMNFRERQRHGRRGDRGAGSQHDGHSGQGPHLYRAGQNQRGALYLLRHIRQLRLCGSKGP